MPPWVIKVPQLKLSPSWEDLQSPQSSWGGFKAPPSSLAPVWEEFKAPSPSPWGGQSASPGLVPSWGGIKPSSPTSWSGLPASPPTLVPAWGGLPASPPTVVPAWGGLPASPPTLVPSWGALKASQPIPIRGGISPPKPYGSFVDLEYFKHVHITPERCAPLKNSMGLSFGLDVTTLLETHNQDFLFSLV